MSEVKKKKTENRSSSQSFEFTERQEKVSLIFYAAIVIACIINLVGVIYTIADLLMAQGKLGLFLTLGLGFQIMIIGGLLAGLFFVLILFIGLYRRGTKALLKYVIKTKKLEDKYTHRTDVKIVAGGLLLSCMAIIVGLIILLVYEILIGLYSTTAFSSNHSGNFFSRRTYIVYWNRGCFVCRP